MRNYFFIFLLGLSIISCRSQKQQQPLDTSGALSYDPPGATDTRSKEIQFQERKVYSFNDGQIAFSNKFEGARVIDMEQINDSVFSIRIEAENYPINRSPWYGFKVWSTSTKDITVVLTYKDVKHRYIPKISNDKKTWRKISPERYMTEGEVASAKLTVGSDTLWVAAQELETSSRVNSWVDSVATLPFATKHEIGYSTLGKPIMCLHMGEADGKKVVAILARQHPPEVTGYYAMQEFVKTIAADNDLSNRFRKQFNLVVVPLMNPDGVDNGHWRHNAGGVDLNRDWRYFHQPETAAYRDHLIKYVKENRSQVYFGLDFHSTDEDIFYVYNPDIISVIPGFTQQWLKGIEAALPGYKLNQEAFGLESPILKNWFFNEFKAEAVTFEIGDETDRQIIRMKGRIAAEEMMKILLNKK
jgi:cytosolic carboxypeptidase protein 6